MLHADGLCLRAKARVSFTVLNPTMNGGVGRMLLWPTSATLRVAPAFPVRHLSGGMSAVLGSQSEGFVLRAQPEGLRLQHVLPLGPLVRW